MAADQRANKEEGMSRALGQIIMLNNSCDICFLIVCIYYAVTACSHDAAREVLRSGSMGDEGVPGQAAEGEQEGRERSRAYVARTYIHEQSYTQMKLHLTSIKNCMLFSSHPPFRAPAAVSNTTMTKISQ